MLSDMTFTNETTAEPESAGGPAPVGKLASVSLDCTDPSALAEFYGNLLRMRQVFASADGGVVALSDGALAVTMMRAENPRGRPPTVTGRLARTHRPGRPSVLPHHRDPRLTVQLIGTAAALPALRSKAPDLADAGRFR
jgi:hypothetical protein